MVDGPCKSIPCRKDSSQNKQSRKIDMPVSINWNSASRYAAYNLEKAQTSLQSSLSILSSGKRIVQPYDDAAGEAVQLKLKAAVTRYGQVKNTNQRSSTVDPVDPKCCKKKEMQKTNVNPIEDRD